MLHGVVGLYGAVHAQHAQELWVARGNGPQAHQGAGARRADHVDQGAHFVGRIAQQHTATGIDVRPLGTHQQAQSLANLARMPFAHRVVRAHGHIFWVAAVKGLFERHILGNVHHHRAWTPRAGNVESLFDGKGQIGHVFDQKIVFDDGPRDAHGIALLKRIQANRMGGHLTREHHQRDAVHVSGGDARDRIRHTRTRCDQGHTHLAGGARITVSGVHGRLLMAHQDMLNGVLLVQRVVDVENSPARIAPEVLDPFGLQGLDHDFGTHQLLRGGEGNGGC